MSGNRLRRTGVAAILLLSLVLAASAATTSVHVMKLANDGTTVIAEQDPDYRWLEANLPVLGDGTTHYYLQGPVFNATTVDERWNPAEDDNVLPKDMGAVKGTDLADICDLAGGMGPEDTVLVEASDGFSKVFPYGMIYEPDPRQGPVVLAWYRQGEGYVPSYQTGMRLVFFADTSTNPQGVHAFGNWDAHECVDPEYWHYYYQGSEKYPTTTGLSVQSVSKIVIRSTEPPPESPVASFTAVPADGTAPLAVTFTDTSSGNPAWWNWSFGDGGKGTDRNPVHTYGAPGSYTVVMEAGNAAGTSSASGSVTVRQPGVSYDEDRTVTPSAGATPTPAVTVTGSGGTEPVVVYRTPVPGADPVDVYRLRARADAATTVQTTPPPRTLSVSYEAAEQPAVTAIPAAAEYPAPTPGDSAAGPVTGSSGGSRGIVGRVIDGIFRVLSLFGLS